MSTECSHHFHYRKEWNKYYRTNYQCNKEIDRNVDVRNRYEQCCLCKAVRLEPFSLYRTYLNETRYHRWWHTFFRRNSDYCYEVIHGKKSTYELSEGR